MATTDAEDPTALTRSLAAAGQLAREQIFSFGVFYVSIFAFILLYLFSVRAIESGLDRHFQQVIDGAIVVTALDQPISEQIHAAVAHAVDDSRWVRWGGAEVTTLVLASDGVTWLYVNGREIPQPEGLDPTDVLRQAVDLLPASADVTASLPHNALLANGVLILYAGVLLQFLYVYNRRTGQREAQRLQSAMAARDATSNRAEEISQELERMRRSLREIEPADPSHTEEIHSLQRERQQLQAQLSRLATREEELRGKADQAIDLEQEVRALEDLLEEAGGDLSSKDEEIRDLERNLKRASRGTARTGGKARGTEQMAKRLHTLYKDLQIDDRAIDDMIALRDEGMKLKAEEKLKRLSEEADNVSVRRKVGGLPDHLSIFELGFAGKGRIYYTRGDQQRFRILAIGAKNTQDADLEYLRRLAR